jgi:elongator complex protein 3
MTKSYKFSAEKYSEQLLEILLALKSRSQVVWTKFLREFPKPEGGIFAKYQLMIGYHHLVAAGKLEEDEDLLAKLVMKPTRSISGVAPLTVLTKPFPCPGKCIFCPNDIRMPKSYLSDEPGAQRAERNSFDPYLQTYNRLRAFKATGHNTDKIELIILGGTWSYYPKAYQNWFIKRCFDALNDFGVRDGRDQVHTVNQFSSQTKNKAVFDKEGKRISYNRQVMQVEIGARAKSRQAQSSPVSASEEIVTDEQLVQAQLLNETALSRCVGLVIETRPDHIDEAEVKRVRFLGATKTQIGFQSLSDEVLSLNKRGHDVAATSRAVSLVRTGGFKIHAHWMPNLYGSNPEMDKQDFDKLFTPEFQPDELKLYPCSLIESAELMDYYNKGLWKPYTQEELLDVLVHAISNTPRHVRLTRIIRDIPSTDIVAGNKKTNFREMVQRHMESVGLRSQDIRSREIKGKHVSLSDLELKVSTYKAMNYLGPTTEHFLEFVTGKDEIAGFLRLSLPKNKENFIEELAGKAIIREIHVYGIAQQLGQNKQNAAQHLGLGSKLIEKATEMSREAGFKEVSVISAIGTRGYYRKKGFTDGELYQHMQIA